MTSQKLLITGSSGQIGRILMDGLSDSFDIYGLDLVSNENNNNTYKADITDPGQIRSVFERIPSLTYVIHLASDPRMDADWQSAYVELAADQVEPFDYAVVSPLVDEIVEARRSRSELLAAGYPVTAVDDCLLRIARAEYKRRQAPPGIKVTGKAFGIGRRVPIAHAFRRLRTDGV